MAESKLLKGIEGLVTSSAKGLATLQTNVDKILWGDPSKAIKASANTATTSTRPTGSAQQAELPVSGSTRVLRYNPFKPQANKPSVGQRLAETGLYSALEVLTSVDLCNVVTYAFDNINRKKVARPPRQEWKPIQVVFYGLQDKAGIAVGYIDKFEAYPSAFIGSYTGVGPNLLPPNQAVNQTSAPTQGGLAVQAYNLYFLNKSIQDLFVASTNISGSQFTQDDVALLQQVPGLSSNLNFLTGYLKEVSKYTDYRQINSTDLVALQAKVGKIRAVLTTIQNLSFKSTTALVGSLVGIDIRREIQKISEFVDLTKIVPTLKEINNNVIAFIRIANQIQKIVTLAQFFIKLAILLIKVFRFIKIFFNTNPLPLLFGTAGSQTTLQGLANTAKSEVDGLTRGLQSLNELLKLVVAFIRYLVVNANELLIRLDKLLLTLDGCGAFKDGAGNQATDVLLQLKQTRSNLNTLLDQLTTYVADLDTKTDPNSATFGIYQIRIIDEELTDNAIVNKRRRGVALDRNGRIVAQSDLTFATDPQVILGEVRQKLISLGLVGPQIGGIDADSIAVINESMGYLNTDDILQDDLNVSTTLVDSPDNLDETKGLGLNAFINNLKGGRKLRTRVRSALLQSKSQLDSQIAAEKSQAQSSLKGG